LPIFVPEPLDHPITLCLLDGRPETAGFIHESVNLSVTFTDNSTQDIHFGDKIAPICPNGLWPAMAAKHQYDDQLVGTVSHLQNRPSISITVIGFGQGVLNSHPVK